MLPNGWTPATLIDVCRLLNGRAYKQDELLESGRWPVLRVGNFFSNNRWYFSSLELDEDKYCHNGDLLYAWSASFGPKIWNGGEAIYHYHIWKTVPNPTVIDKYFLYRWFDWDQKNIKADHGTGSTMIHVTKGDMEQRKLAVPPLAEQRRIVAKLDVLTARIARARAELDRVPVLVKRLRHSSLVHGLSGGLAHGANTLEASLETVDQQERGEWDFTELPQGWRWVRFEEFLKDETDGRRKLPERDYLEAGPYPVVDQGTSHFGGFSDRSDLVHPAKRPVVVFGDHTRAVKFVQPPFIQGADGVRVLTPLTGVSVRYAYYALLGARLPTKGYSRHMKFVRRTLWPLPPEADQLQIVGYLDSAFARVDRIEAEAVRVRALLDRLEAAILGKAFRGELVPQDPDEEPASVLLDRIRAERAAAPKPKRGRRPGSRTPAEAS